MKKTLCWTCKHAWALGCERFRGDPDIVIEGSEYEITHFFVKRKNVKIREITQPCILSCPNYEEGRISPQGRPIERDYRN
jgi:hypothetical protein